MRNILLVLALLFSSTCFAEEPIFYRYDELIRHIEAGNIESINIDNYSYISGNIRSTGNIKEFTCYGDTGSSNDPLLISLLKEHNIPFTLTEVSDSRHKIPTITGFVMFFVPLVTLILLIVLLFMVRRITVIQKNNQQSG